MLWAQFQKLGLRGTGIMSKRCALHAGQWYPSNKNLLDKQLEEWLQESAIPVDETARNVQAIIVPHAGYKYSGSVASKCYSLLRNMKPKLIVLLGPSHFKLCENKCALSDFSSVETPLGDIKVSTDICRKLEASSPNLFTALFSYDDLKEHSLEMHFPFIYKIFKDTDMNLIPIQVGHFSDPLNRREAAKSILESISNVDHRDILFIVSSDFCHYGHRFGYFPKFSDDKYSLNENISIMDKEGLNTLNKVDPISAFTDYLKATENTICGREAILLLLEILKQIKIEGNWKLIDYSQSNLLTSNKDSSVSYLAAAFETDECESRD